MLGNLNRKNMTTLIIEDSAPQAKKFIAYGRTLPFVKVRKEKPAPKSELYHNLDRAFADVRLMMDGKKRKKTIEEFIDELRNSND